jgi:O-antigen/teichoic acid export membrane protein
MRQGLAHFVFVTAPKVLGGIGTLGMNLMLIRYLGADDLGMLSLCLAGVLLMDAVAGSALDMGTLKLASASYAESPATSREIQLQAIYFKLLIMLGALLAINLFGKQLWTAVTHHTLDARLLYLSWAAALGLLLIRSVQVQLQVEEKFLYYGLLDLLHLSLRFGGIAILLLLGRAIPADVLFCYAAAPLIVVTLWAAFWSRDIIRSPRVRPGLIAEIFHCVKWFLLTFSLSSFISRMDLILLSRWSNLHEAGIFSAAQIIAYIPQMVGFYWSVVFAPKIMPQLAAGKFNHFFRTTQTWILVLTAAALVAFIPLWKLLAHFVLPPKYIASSAVILALMPGALAGMATFPLTLAFLMFIKPRFLFFMDCASLVFLIALYWFAIHRYGALGAAWTTTFAAISRATLAQIVAWRLAAKTSPAALVALNAQVAVSQV